MSKQEFNAVSDRRLMDEQKPAAMCPNALALGLEIDAAMLESLGSLARSSFRAMASFIGHEVLRQADTDEAAAAMLLHQRLALAGTDHAVLWERISRGAGNLLDEHGNPSPMAGRVLRSCVTNPCQPPDITPQGGGGSGPIKPQ